MRLTRRSNPIASLLLAFVLSSSFDGGAVAGELAGVEEIVIVTVQGTVRLTMKGEARTAKAGAVLELPASIHTGPGAAIELRQGRTTVGVAGDSQLEIPATAIRGNPIERLIQTQGHVFYNVGKRTTQKLRVETPYLVAVVKGTQFNVAIQADSSTISLFEGLLEVRATDDSDVINLKAGEIAIRHAKDQTIRVLGMNEDKASDGKQQDGGERSTSGNSHSGMPAALSLDREITEVGVGADISVDMDPSAAASANLGADASIDIGHASADLADVSADLGLDAVADLGSGSVDLGADAGADVGDAAVDAGVDTGVDLSSGSVELSADAGADLGGSDAGLSLDAEVDAGSGTVDVGVDASIGGVDVGVDAELDPGVDLSLGGDSSDTGTDTGAGDGSDGGNLLDGVLGGLLGGLNR